MEEKIAKITKQLLKEIGENPEREGLLKTPKRVAKAWDFFSYGYKQNLDDIVNQAIFNEGFLKELFSNRPQGLLRRSLDRPRAAPDHHGYPWHRWRRQGVQGAT